MSVFLLFRAFELHAHLAQVLVLLASRLLVRNVIEIRSYFIAVSALELQILYLCL